MRKSKGPKIEPWGTLLDTGSRSENMPSNSIYCSRRQKIVFNYGALDIEMVIKEIFDTSNTFFAVILGQTQI